MSNGNNYYHFPYLPHWRYPLRLPGVTGLYLNTTLRIFAVGLVGIFVPLFIYRLTHSISSVIAFFIFWKLIQLVIALPVAFLITRIGPDLSIALAALVQIIFLVSLIFSIRQPQFLLLAPLAGAIAIPLHWIPYHTAFSQESDQKKLGKQVSIMAVLQRVAAAFAPFIGGVLASELGFGFLYLIAIIFLIISIFPVFMDQYQKKDQWQGGKKVIKNIFSRRFRPFLTAFLGTGAEAAVYTIFWPLFLWEKLDNLEKIGLISTISLFLSVLILQWTGRQVAKKNNQLAQVGGLISSFNWLIKSFLSSLPFLAFADLLYQLSTILVWIPTGTTVYRRGEKETTTFFLQREISIQLGFLVSLIICWLFFLLNWGWLMIFLIGGGGIFMASRLKEKNG